jgi:translation initiation factor 2D
LPKRRINDTSPSELYSQADVKALLNNYITSKNLVNPRVQAYINLDDALAACVSKASGKSKNKEATSDSVEYLRRDELVKALLGRMQNWYEVNIPGKDPIRK